MLNDYESGLLGGSIVADSNILQGKQLIISDDKIIGASEGSLSLVGDLEVGGLSN